MARSHSLLPTHLCCRPLAGCWLALAVLLAGCAGSPSRPPAWPDGEGVALAALSELGAPYAYGGSGPRTFDCSGLVQYSYAQAGVHVPRTAKEQFEASRPVPASGMRAGDAVFFRSGWFRHWHVGIYLGDGRFVHAPSGRGTVSIAVLSDPYWSRRFVRAGRFPR